ncbi:hypothetical protein [Bifidobacterium platyrrhinorum]|uniref:Uncharacterized protein n=1 Tax=Bifidobacterium platyrrhinorum TaxID=2661628 RepID=A0A6L9SSA3_9BIFI|nr:hypothetical protein [Bifidobacterium platyrrhinorum]NEG55477.1 hypothetical protein [Bifidobacterium platyrrhinorum]
MTNVKFSVKKPDGTAVEGKLTFTPVRRYFNTAKDLILPYPRSVDLDDKGAATVDLAATNALFVWGVTVSPSDDANLAWTRYVEVPESTTEVAYADLVEVDANTLLPSSMNGVQPVKMRPPVDSLAAAEEESARYPDYLVWYPEGATESKAREMVTSIEQLQAQAATSAAMVTATKAQVASDASIVSDAAVTAGMVSEHVTATKTEIDVKSTEATAAIDKAVQSVQDRAQSAQNDITAVEDETKPDTDTHDGGATGTQTGDGETIPSTSDVDGEPAEE